MKRPTRTKRTTRQSTKAKAAFAVANAFVLAGTAGAADPAPSTPAASGETTLDEVVVRADSETSKYQTPKIDSREYPEPVLNTPQTVNVIPQALMQDQNATSLRDALRNVPGISFQAGEGGVPAGDQLSIRGFSARTDIFIDGIRDIGGYSRDTFNLEQIEVIKGPASAYVGRGSTGGIINMSTKAPRLESFYEGDFGIGTNDYYRLTVDVNQAIPAANALGIEGVAVRFNGLFHTQDFANRNYVSDERWGIAPSISIGLGTPTRATLSYMHLEEDNTPSYGIPFVPNTAPVNPYGGKSAIGKPAPVENRTFFGLVRRDYEENQVDVVTFDLEHDITEDITISNQTRYGRTYRDSIISAPRLVTNNPNPVNGPVPFGINRQIQSRDQLDSIVANLTTLNASFETWGIEHELVAAGEYNYEYESNYLRAANPLFTIPNADPALPPTPYFAELGDPYDPNAYDRFKPVFRTGARNQSWSQSGALSVFDNITLSEHWLINLGLRVDYFSTEVEQRDAAGAITKLSQDEWQPTWRTGIVFKPVPSASIYFSYGTSFNPSAENLTLSPANAGLPPEESSSFEIGGKWDLLDNKLSISGAVFRINKENARSVDPTNSADVSLSGSVYVQGIEIGVAGNITEEWAVFAGYSVMQSKILEDRNPLTVGNELPNTPEQTANFWTTYSLPFGVQVGTGVTYVDSRYANTLNDRSAPGYILQDAMISYQINDNASVQLNVANMWNEEYIDRVGGGHAIPGVGRTFIVSTRLQF